MLQELVISHGERRRLTYGVTLRAFLKDVYGVATSTQSVCASESTDTYRRVKLDGSWVGRSNLLPPTMAMLAAKGA